MKNIKLTRKQKVFADIILNNPKEPAGKAAELAYKTKNDNVARVIASENLTKPNIVAYLEEHAERAEESVLEIADYSKQFGKAGDKPGASYASVALAAYNSVLDRVHGKATQKIESTSTSVNLNLDLSDITE